MHKKTIEKNFSRCARHYDAYATVQSHSALKLIAKIELDKFNRILDIGCGTGNYTKLLRDRFPSAEITALDISKEMIAQAKSKLKEKGIEFVIMDAEAIDFNKKFDLITSNASLQWLENLEASLARYRGLLKKNGVILFSLFGLLTLRELNTSLGELFKKDALISSCNFIDENRLEGLLKKYFKKISIDEEFIREKHNSIWELLNKIKYTGARGDGINRNILKSDIMELEKIYRRKFGDSIATYQVFYCRAVK